MKKYLFGIFAIALAIGFSAFTSVPKVKKSTKTSFVYWYDIHPSTSRVMDENPLFYNKDEDEILGLQHCQDHEDQPICVAGSDTELELNQSVSGFPEEALVRECDH